MSYILDALRKSDQQRQRGAAPTLLAVQTPAVAPKQPALLAYGLLVAVVVGVGVVIGWLRPWQTEQRAPEPKSFTAKPLESTPREPGPAPSAVAPQPAAPELQTTQAEPAPSETAPQPKLQQKLKTVTRPKAKLSARAKLETDGPPHDVDPAAADAAVGPPVLSLAELPPQIRQALPAMTISVHGYSEKPEARLVGINYRILREGDSVVPGLELQQITPDGMIFSFKGYRFRRGVK